MKKIYHVRGLMDCSNTTGHFTDSAEGAYRVAVNLIKNSDFEPEEEKNMIQLLPSVDRIKAFLVDNGDEPDSSVELDDVLIITCHELFNLKESSDDEMMFM